MILDKKIPLTYILGKIKTELPFLLIVGLIVNYLSTVYVNHIPEMPLNVPTFLGTAISILLSFKMSQSYDRWWEARKVWGAIVNDARSLVIQLQSFVPANRYTVVKTIAFRQIAWCYCLGQSLRGQDPLQGLEEYLSKDDLAAISTHSNKVLAILQLNAADLRALREEKQIEIFSHVQIDSTLVRLCDSMGKAERINSTVFPVTYRLFLHFSIYLFVIILSIALKDVEPLFELPLLILISSLFLLLERTAFHLQDPFKNRPSDVAVTTIARNIEINIKQLLGEKNIPEPLKSDKFYQL